MGVTRRSVLGGLALGLGQGIENYTAQGVKRRQIADQRSFDLAKHQGDTIQSLADKIAAHPETADTLISASGMDPLLAGVDLSRLRPSSDTLMRPLLDKVNSAKSPLDIPSDLAGAAQSADARLAPTPAADPTKLAGAQFMEPSGLADTAPMNKPKITDLIALAERRKQTLDEETQQKIEDAGKMSQSQGYGSAVGSNRAKNEQAPLDLQQLLDKITKEGPLLATNAGLVAAAQFDAAHTPDRQRSGAQTAGMTAGAQESGRLGAQQRMGVGEFAPVNIDEVKQTTLTGRSYLTLQNFSGKQKEAALKAALAAGVPVISKEDANALQEIDQARMNQKSILDGLMPRLPKDAAGRIAGGALSNKIGAYLQTKEDLSAFGSNRAAAIQALRAIAGSKGLRINKAEIQMSMDSDIPQVTDTVGTALQRVKNVGRLLENAEKSILVRDRSTLSQ